MTDAQPQALAAQPQTQQPSHSEKSEYVEDIDEILEGVPEGTIGNQVRERLLKIFEENLQAIKEVIDKVFEKIHEVIDKEFEKGVKKIKKWL